MIYLLCILDYNKQTINIAICLCSQLIYSLILDVCPFANLLLITDSDYPFGIIKVLFDVNT